MTPPPKRDDEVAPLDVRLDQRVADAREFGIGLRRFARRADDDADVFSPAASRLGRKRLEMQRRDRRVGDDGAMRAGRERRDMGAGGVDQPGADQDRVGARAERDVDARPRAAPATPAAVRRARRAQARQDQRLDDRVMRAVARFDRQVGERVGRAALLEQPAQGLFGIGGAQQRPIGALAHPAQQHLEIRLQPNRDAALGDAPARRLVHEGAAAGRQHLGPVVQQTGDHLALALAKIRLRRTARKSRGSSFARPPRSRRRRRRRAGRGVWASRLPTEVLPAPIMPTSTIDRPPRAAASPSASGIGARRRSWPSSGAEAGGVPARRPLLSPTGGALGHILACTHVNRAASVDAQRLAERTSNGH